MYVFRKRGLRDNFKRITREENDSERDDAKLKEQYVRREIQDESFRRAQEKDFIQSLTSYHLGLMDNYLNTIDGMGETEEVANVISLLNEIDATNSEAKEDVRDIFGLIDQDFSGYIDMQELGHLLSILGYNPSKKTLNKAVESIFKPTNKMDNSQVKISFDEFYKWYIDMRSSETAGDFTSMDTENWKKHILHNTAQSLIQFSKNMIPSMFSSKFSKIVMQTRARKYLRRAIEFQASELARVEYRKAKPPKFYCPNCVETFLTVEEMNLHAEQAALYHADFHSQRESLIHKIRPIWDALQGDNGHKLHANRLLFDFHMVPSLFRSAVCIQQPIRPFIADKNEFRSKQLKQGMKVEGYDPSVGKRPGFQTMGMKIMHLKQCQRFTKENSADNQEFADVLLNLQTEWVYQAIQTTIVDALNPALYSWITMTDQPSQCCEIKIWWSGQVRMSACIRGSFTGWENVTMTSCPKNGKYNLTVSVSPAIHYYCFVIDGVQMIERNQPIAVVQDIRVGEHSDKKIFYADRNVLVVSNTSVKASSDYLHHLQLSEKDLNDDGIWALSQALSRHKTINYVDLSTNRISDRGAESISSVIRLSDSLITLKLSNNNIGYDGCRAISESLFHNFTLQYLDLRQNPLGDDGVEALCIGLTRHKFMKVVCFDRCRISDDGAKILSDAIIHQKSLMTLSLRYNDIHETGASHLAEALSRNASIRNLYLSHNPLLATGCERIFTELSKNDTLLRLDMSFTNMGYRSSMNAVTAFADMIKLHKSLMWVDICGNELGNTAALQIADNIRYNTGILQVDIEFNDIDDCWRRSMNYIPTHLSPQMPSIQTTCDLNKLRNIGKVFLFLVCHHNLSLLRSQGKKVASKPGDLSLGLQIDEIYLKRVSLDSLIEGPICENSPVQCSWQEVKSRGNLQARRKVGMKPWEFMESDVDVNLKRIFDEAQGTSKSVVLRREFQRRSGFCLCYTLVDFIWPLTQQISYPNVNLDIPLLPLVVSEFSYGDINTTAMPAEVSVWFQNFRSQISECVIETKRLHKGDCKGQWSSGRRWIAGSTDICTTTNLSTQKTTETDTILHTNPPIDAIVEPKQGLSDNECKKMFVESIKKKKSFSDDEFSQAEDDFVQQQLQTMIITVTRFLKSPDSLLDVQRISCQISSILQQHSTSSVVQRMSDYCMFSKPSFQSAFDRQSMQDDLMKRFPELKKLGIMFAACVLSSGLGNRMDVDEFLCSKLNCWSADLKSATVSKTDNKESRWDKEIFDDQLRQEQEAKLIGQGEVAIGKYGSFNSMECHVMLREAETVSNEVVLLASKCYSLMSSVRGCLLRDRTESFATTLSAIQSCGFKVEKMRQSEKLDLAGKVVTDPGMELINVLMTDADTSDYAASLAKIGCISLEEEQARYLTSRKVVAQDRNSKIAPSKGHSWLPMLRREKVVSEIKEYSTTRHSVSVWALSEAACCGFLGQGSMSVSNLSTSSSNSVLNLFPNLDVETISRLMILLGAMIDCIDGSIALFRIAHPPRYLCPVCKKRFTKARHLQDHLASPRSQFNNIHPELWINGRPDESIILCLHHQLHKTLMEGSWSIQPSPVSECLGYCQFAAFEMLRLSIHSLFGNCLAQKFSNSDIPEPTLPLYFISSPTAEIRVYDAFDRLRRPLGILTKNSVVKIMAVYGNWARINIERGTSLAYVQITYPSLDSTLIPIGKAIHDTNFPDRFDPVYSASPNEERGSFDPRFNPEFKVRRGPKRSRRIRQMLVNSSILQMSLFNLDPSNFIHTLNFANNIAFATDNYWFCRVRSILPVNFRVKVRQRPTFDAAVIGTLVAGQVFKIVGLANGSWLQIEHPSLSSQFDSIYSSFWVASCIEGTYPFQTLLGYHIHKIQNCQDTCPLHVSNDKLLFNEPSDSGQDLAVEDLIMSDSAAQSIKLTPNTTINIDQDISEESYRVRNCSKFCNNFANELETAKDF